MKTYKKWPLLEVMPDGWSIDKTAGSPLAGYDFVTNGRSVLNGQKRALLLVCKPQMPRFTTDVGIDEQPDMPISKKENKSKQIIDANYVKTVNELARQKFKEKMLQEILVDLVICEFEGWPKLEYINELKHLINGIANKKNCDA